MLVFVSWSGHRSKTVAEALESWLSQVIQAVEPWISVDIKKGARWGPEISERLEKSRVGIVCLTRENLESRWILFESGALSKTKDAQVCTFLVGIAPADVKPPLSHFQHTTTSREDVFRLLQTVNTAVANAGGRCLSDKILTTVFETNWPTLQARLKVALEMEAEIAAPVRTERELLDEILTTVRNIDRRAISIDKRPTQKAGDLARILRSSASIGALEDAMRKAADLGSEQKRHAYTSEGSADDSNACIFDDSGNCINQQHWGANE
jgi:hypothetical protein